MLTSLLSNVILGLLSAIGGWLVRHFQQMAKDATEKKAADDATAAATQALKDAKTQGDIDGAAKGVADDL